MQTLYIKNLKKVSENRLAVRKGLKDTENSVSITLGQKMCLTLATILHLHANISVHSNNLACFR